MILISPSASHQTAIFRLKAQLIKPKSYQALVPSPEKMCLSCSQPRRHVMVVMLSKWEAI